MIFLGNSLEILGWAFRCTFSLPIFHLQAHTCIWGQSCVSEPISLFLLLNCLQSRFGGWRLDSRILCRLCLTGFETIHNLKVILVTVYHPWHLLLLEKEWVSHSVLHFVVSWNSLYLWCVLRWPLERAESGMYFTTLRGKHMGYDWYWSWKWIVICWHLEKWAVIWDRLLNLWAFVSLSVKWGNKSTSPASRMWMKILCWNQEALL